MDPQSPVKIRDLSQKDLTPLEDNNISYVQKPMTRKPSQDKHPSRTRASLSGSSITKALESCKDEEESLLIPKTGTQRGVLAPSDAVTRQDRTVEPETPQSPPLDLFSPTESDTVTSKGQSSVVVGRGDTPPPPDLGGASSSFGRSSRRARGSVSYAEPNLRDKMRRPGKELVDAVAVGSKPSSGTGEKSATGNEDANGQASSNSERGRDVADILRRSDNTLFEQALRKDEREQAITTSPLGKKTTGHVHGEASILETLAPLGDTKQQHSARSSSSDTIAALMKTSALKRDGNNSTRQKERPINVPDGTKAASPVKGDSIFDFTGTPPQSPSPASKTGLSSTQGRQSSISSTTSLQRTSTASSRRRHSSAITSTLQSTKHLKSINDERPARLETSGPSTTAPTSTSTSKRTAIENKHLAGTLSITRNRHAGGLSDEKEKEKGENSVPALAGKLKTSRSSTALSSSSHRSGLAVDTHDNDKDSVKYRTRDRDRDTKRQTREDEAEAEAEAEDPGLDDEEDEERQQRQQQTRSKDVALGGGAGSAGTGAGTSAANRVANRRRSMML